MSSEVILLSTPENQILADKHDRLPAKSKNEAVLKDVVAYVEVRTRTENRSKGVAYQLEQLGAKVVTKLDNDVTHVIWKDGKKPTLERAQKRGLHVVSVLWVESCKQNQEHVDERMFAVTGREERSPLFVPKVKRRKFMEPKDLEEDLQDSRERLAKRRKRRDAPLTVAIPGRVLAEETPYRHSPTRYLPGPPFSPSLIPNTPDSMRACLDKLDSIKAQSPFVYQKPTLGDSPTCGTFNLSGSPSDSPLEKRDVVGSLIDRLLASDTDEPSPLERVCLKSKGNQDTQGHRTKLSKALFQHESSSGFKDESVKEKRDKLRQMDGCRQDSSLEDAERDGERNTGKRMTRASLGRGKKKSLQATSDEVSACDKGAEFLVLNETSVGNNGVTGKRTKNLGRKGKTSTKIVNGEDFAQKENKEDVAKASQNIEKVNSMDHLSEQARTKSDLMRVNRELGEEAIPSKRRRSSRGVKLLPIEVGDATKELSDKSEVPREEVVATGLSGVDRKEARVGRRSGRGLQLLLEEKKDETSHKDMRKAEKGTGKRLAPKTRRHDSRADSEVMEIILDSPEEKINGTNDKENNVRNLNDNEKEEGERKSCALHPGSGDSHEGQDVGTDKGSNRTPGQKRPLKDPSEEGEGKRRPKRRKLLRLQTYEEPPLTLIDPKESVEDHTKTKSEGKTKEMERMKDQPNENRDEDGKKMRKRLSSKAKKDFSANSQTDTMVQLSQPTRRSLEDFEGVKKKPPSMKADDGDKSEDSGIESSKNVSMDSNGSPTDDNEGRDESCQDTGGRLKKNKTTRNKQLFKPRKPTVVMTSLHRSEQDVIVSVIRTLGGFKITDSVDETTTHVIIGDPRRTLNVLSAIGHGCWLLSKEWVLNSLESGHWLPEEPFEVHSAFPAAKLSRELKSQSTRDKTHLDLFSEFGSIFISESSSPPSERLADLILLCGGSVSKGQRQADLCVGRTTIREEVPMVQEKWVLDCISEMKASPIGPYKLHSDEKLPV